MCRSRPGSTDCKEINTNFFDKSMPQKGIFLFYLRLQNGGFYTRHFVLLFGYKIV
jgi:hypothetical protein